MNLRTMVAGLHGGVTTVSHQNCRCATGNPSHRRCFLSSPELIRLPKTKPCPSLDPNSGPLPLLSQFAEILSRGAAVRTRMMAEFRGRIVVTAELELAATNAGAN
ncbi:hypothetical protein PIB30_089504, partial [Stylosanthes scabra]|nr:hypothetical protein [Stylosanthes scabra]